MNGGYPYATLAGRTFGMQFLDHLPTGDNVYEENGEFHIFITAEPDFVHSLNVVVEKAYIRFLLHRENAPITMPN